MAEKLTLGLFFSGLLVCLLSGQAIIWALLFGLGCFCGYSLYRGYTYREIGAMLWEGVVQIKIILVIFVLIGLLTAVWRICGTIPFILCQAIDLIQPRYFVLCTFLLCSAMSFLTGTSFGTASTMGVICMMLARSAGIDSLLTGGAVLSGIFFGDRCSPMSSSAQLVCTLTLTNIYANIRHMVQTAAIPFAISCLFYYLAAPLSVNFSAKTATTIFSQTFTLSWLSALPAVIILVLALCQVHVIIAMTISIASGCIIALAVESVTPLTLLAQLLGGYQAPNSALAVLLNGGGLLSMLSVSLIVLISSSYSGIFLHTGLLNGLIKRIEHLAQLFTSFGATVITATCASAISCNQTLATTLTHQLCGDLFTSKTQRALALEDTAIVIAALIPWSIAGAVPIAAIGASSQCLFYAVYLYAIPLWNWAAALWCRHRCTPKNET